MSAITLQATGICKHFPGVKALDDVSLTLRRGRLTALLGENGAGKSTLMNILAGVFPPDAGEVLLDGEPVRFHSPREANAAGVAMIHQELNLFGNLTVAQNLFLGREPLNRLGLIDKSTLHEQAKVLLDKLDLDVDPGTPLANLRVGQQQVVEIAKAVSCEARVLIMDEPTSAITEHEIDVLFGIIDDLKRQGVAIAYITHKLEELGRIGDDALVMRDGQSIGAAPLTDLSHDEIVRMMVGRTFQGMEFQGKTGPSNGEVILQAVNLSLPHPERSDDYVLREIDLNVKKGEVLGIFGLMGAGRTELLETLFGLHAKRVRGDLQIHGKTVTLGSPREAIQHGLALAPEDRKREGLVLGMTVGENATLASLRRFERGGWLQETPERKSVEEAIERFHVKTPSGDQRIRNLSGGNQQKVVLAKWLATDPEVLLLDEPTRGIDVNAKAEIYALIRELVSEGLAVVVVSSELPEILTISDRIAVLCEGRKTAEFERSAASEEAIMKAALPT